MAVEHTVALTGQVGVQFLRVDAVLGAGYAVFSIAFLVGDKNIIRRELARVFYPSLPYPLDILCRIAVLRGNFGIGQCRRFLGIAIP